MKKFNISDIKKIVYLSCSIAFLNSCSSPECYEFTSEENKWYPYEVGDTLIFSNNYGDTLVLVANEEYYRNIERNTDFKFGFDICVTEKVITFQNVLGKGRTEKRPFEMHYYIQNVGDQFAVIFSESIYTPMSEEYYFNNTINLEYTFSNGINNSLFIISDSIVLDSPWPEYKVFRYGFDKSGVKIFNLGLDPDATFELIEQK